MTRIYHITHIDNLQGIINEGGLRCDRISSEQGLCARNIAYQHIKERRAIRPVTVSRLGALWDYVPFYFCPRSPMLYANYRGNVSDYTDGQTPIVHIVSTAEYTREYGIPYFFTDGHAEMEFSIQYDNLEQLEELDWEVINSKYWFDTMGDDDRKRRKQSEFLVFEFFPWNLISEIGVINQNIHNQVAGIIKDCSHQPAITIHPEWYY